jgi:hypothetical protein
MSFAQKIRLLGYHISRIRGQLRPTLVHSEGGKGGLPRKEKKKKKKKGMERKNVVKCRTRNEMQVLSSKAKQTLPPS